MKWTSSSDLNGGVMTRPIAVHVDELRGRDHELGVTAHLIDRVLSADGAALTFVGPPGIGKTALLRQAAREARGRGVTVIELVGHPAERDVDWAGVTQLVSPLVKSIDRLDDHPRSALRRAMRLESGAPIDPVVVAMAVLLVLGMDDRPVLVLVDDLHWIDASSANVLGFVARRLGATPIGLLATRRAEGAVTPGIAVQLGPLPAEVLRRIAIDRSAVPPVADLLVAECGGNPLVLHRMIDALDGDQLRGARPLPLVLPSSRTEEPGIDERVGGIDPTDRAVLVALAVSPELQPGRLTELVGADRGSLDRLENARLVVSTPTGYRFAHPTDRSSAYWSVDAVVRREVHRRLTAVDDPVRAAWHAAAATVGRDESVARRLDAAADEVSRRGGHFEALRLLERAIELGEGPMVERRMFAARVAIDARLPDVATELISFVPTTSATRLLSAEIAWSKGDVHAGRTLWEQVAIDAEASTDERLEARRRAAVGAFRMYDLPAVLDLAAGSPDDELLGVIDLMARSVLGDVNATAELGDRMADIVDAVTIPLSTAAEVVALALARSGMESEMVELAEAVLRRSVVAEPLLVPPILIAQAAHRSRSDLVGAVVLTEQALELIDEWGLPEHRPFALGLLSTAQGAIGRPEALDTARQLREYRAPIALGIATYVEALVLLASHDHAGAVAVLEPLHEQHGDDPTIGFSWHCELAESAVRVDRIDLARRVLDDIIRLSDTNPTMWMRGTRHRLSGLLAAEWSDAVEQFELAEAAYRQGGQLVSAGRVMLNRAERLRRARRRSAAREALGGARRLLDAAGAVPGVERCDAEAAALGIGPLVIGERAGSILTARELQVARWLVEGATFREIGERLFLSPRTAESHGQAIYRKLGVRGRAGLAQLAIEDPTLMTSR